MNVSLTPDLESFIDDKVKSGAYGSASDVVRAGLRLLQEQDIGHGARVNQLREDVRRGRAQLERGEGGLGAEVFARLRNNQ